MSIPTDVSRQPLYGVLARLQETIREDPTVAPADRRSLGQAIAAIVSYINRADDMPPLSPAEEIVDATEAMQLLGYRSPSSISNAVERGELVPFRERVTPKGFIIRYFTRAEIHRYRAVRPSDAV